MTLASKDATKTHSNLDIAIRCDTPHWHMPPAPTGTFPSPHQRRIDKGDQKAGTAVDPTVFLGVKERLEELEQGGGAVGASANYRPYSDNPDSASVRVALSFSSLYF